MSLGSWLTSSPALQYASPVHTYGRNQYGFGGQTAVLFLSLSWLCCESKYLGHAREVLQKEAT